MSGYLVLGCCKSKYNSATSPEGQLWSEEGESVTEGVQAGGMKNE